MYSLINQNVGLILDQLSSKDTEAYSWLMANLASTNVSSNAAYQSKYRNFWVMLYPSQTYCQAYFRLLQRLKGSKSIDPVAVCQALRLDSKGKSGNDIIQFSFATKLAHMTNPDLPIYDHMIRQFYFLPTPAGDLAFDARLAGYLASYSFLKDEYRRVIADGLLARAIQEFRRVFPMCEHSDVKVIDWLIWWFVKMAESGAFQLGSFRHV